MKISVDVHNYMETLVGQILGEPKYVSRFSSEQLADLACLALVQLKPVYIRHDIDFLCALPEERLMSFKESCENAVANAIEMIINDRRQNRVHDDYPVVFSHVRYDEDVALEWFEKPILEFYKKDRIK